MTDTERPTGNGEDVVQKARVDIQQEIAEAGADVPKKTSIIQSLFNRFFNRDVAVDEVQRHVEINRGAVKNEKKEEAGKNLESLAKIFEAVKQIKSDPALQQKAGIPVRSLVLIEKLDAKIGGRINESNASFIYPLVAKALQKELTAAEVETEFNKLRTLIPYSRQFVQHVSEVLIEAVQQGNLPGMSGSEANKKFNVAEQERQLKEEAMAEMAKQQRGMPGEEGIASSLPLKSNEVVRLEQLSNRLQRSDISPVEKTDINERLRTGQITEEDKRKIIEKAGFNENELEEFQNLIQRVAQADERYFHYDRYFSIADQEKFKLSKLRENGWLTKDGITSEGKRELKKSIYKAVNELMSKVDSYPDADFQSNYSEFHEGYVLRYIQDVVQAFKKEQGWIQYAAENPSGYAEVTEFINNGLLGTIGRERELRELFHNVGIYIKTMTPEDLAKFMQRYNVSLVSSVATEDFSGKLVAMAMNEYERYLKFDIMKNKGKVRAGLFSGQTNPNKLYFEQADYQILRGRLHNVLRGLQEELGYDRTKPLSKEQQEKLRKKYATLINLKQYDIDSIINFEDWELDRALKYAKGLELTQTIRGFEIIASSRPPDGYQGSADNYYDMASNINPNWKWMTGRGVAGPRERYVPETLIAEGIKRRPEASLLRRIFTKGWDPKGVSEEVKVWSEYKTYEKWEHIKDSWLYRDMDFRRLLNKFGLGGLAARAAWRMTGFKDETFFDDISKIQIAIQGQVEGSVGEGFKFAANGERWIETYNQLAKVAGVGTRFWFDGTRAQDFIKRELWKAIGVDPNKTNEDELDRLWVEYTMGKNGEKEIFKLPDGQKYTTIDYLEAKTLVFRGLNFYDLLRRSPMDFLNNIVNLTPKLLTEGLGGTKDVFFEFDEGKLKALIEADTNLKTSADRENRLREVKKFQNLTRRIWGEKNFEHLKFIRSFYKGLEEWGKSKGFADEKGNLNKEKTFEEFYRIMDLATEKVKLENRATMENEDINDEGLKVLMFGKQGLVTHFVELNEDFGEGEDENKVKIDVNLGKDGFFYHFARGWYNELGHALHPDSSDVDWRLVFHKLGATGGENIVKRLWGDLNDWNKVMNGLMTFDQMLQHAAQSHNMDEIYKLHEGIKSLRGIAGKDATYEMQFYLAQIIGRYFQEHSSARLPFPLGTIAGLFKGKELSLSKIYGGLGAMSLTTDGLNTYFQKLKYQGLIPEEGIFGFNRLSKALGADWQKLTLTEIIPNTFSALALFLLFKFIKDSLEESEGKKR